MGVARIILTLSQYHVPLMVLSAAMRDIHRSAAFSLVLHPYCWSSIATVRRHAGTSIGRQRFSSVFQSGKFATAGRLWPTTKKISAQSASCWSFEKMSMIYAYKYSRRYSSAGVFDNDEGLWVNAAEDDYADDNDKFVILNIDEELSRMDDQNECQQEELIEELRSTLLDIIDKEVLRLSRKISSLQAELDKTSKYSKLMWQAMLITSNLYQVPKDDGSVRELVCADWDNGGVEVTLQLNPDKYGSVREEADALFATSRKLKRAGQKAGPLLDETTEALKNMEDRKADTEGSSTKFALESVAEKLRKSGTAIDLGAFDAVRMRDSSDGLTKNSDNNTLSGQKRQKQRTSKNNSSSKQHTFREFLSPGGLTVLVGRNRRDNDALSMQVARGDDLWMHARGCPGAHVVIKVPRRGGRLGSALTEECVQFAANLAVFYSDARTEKKSTVTVCEPKHILKPRGAPLGAVKLRQELKSVIGRPTDVPQECKEKRSENGTWGGEEVGSDKTKNRKKTQAVDKEIIKKKRERATAKNKRRKNKLNSKAETELPDFY